MGGFGREKDIFTKKSTKFVLLFMGNIDQYDKLKICLIKPGSDSGKDP